MSFGDDFHAELGAKIRARCPRATAALIVGSYAFKRPFIDDIDITVFDDSVPSGDERTDQIDARGWTIDVAVRNPDWMDPGRAERENVLYLLREMRKVLAGVVLFDDAGLIARTAPWWRRLEIPVHLVSPFYERAGRLDLGALPPGERRLSLYYGVENMVIGWLHAEMRFRFSKPKWLLWDLEQLGSKAFEALLRSISAELCEAADPGELTRRLEALLPASDDEATRRGLAMCRKMLRDATYMAERGERPAAVWPLRMGAFQLAMWRAQELGLSYRDLRDIGPLLAALSEAQPALRAALSEVLLSERPLPPRFVALFAEALADFGRCLDRRRERAAPAEPP